MRIIEPELLYTENGFLTKQAVCIEDGIILETGKCTDIETRYKDSSAVIEKWEKMVLVPGTINAHNHCFQSLLRGLSCDRPFFVRSSRITSFVFIKNHLRARLPRRPAARKQRAVAGGQLTLCFGKVHDGP